MNDQLINWIVELLAHLTTICCLITVTTFLLKLFIGMVSDILLEITDMKRAYKLVSENKELNKENEELRLKIVEMEKRLYE